MDAVTSGPNVKELVRIPALIALVVTLARLAGELAGGPAMLFNREPGGPGSLVGIVWLVPIFGIYFALKLARSGHAPQSAGKVIGFSLLALLAAAAIGFFGGYTYGRSQRGRQPWRGCGAATGVRGGCSSGPLDPTPSLGPVFPDHAAICFCLSSASGNRHVGNHDRRLG